MTTFTTQDRIDAEVNIEPIPFVGMVNINQTQMTQEAIATELGVSRQTVKNIEESAFKKIRKALFSKGIKKEDLL